MAQARRRGAHVPHDGEKDAMQTFASRLAKTQIEMPKLSQLFDL